MSGEPEDLRRALAGVPARMFWCTTLRSAVLKPEEETDVDKVLVRPCETVVGGCCVPGGLGLW